MGTSSTVGYEYIQKPRKIPWSESISNSFEQIIQSATYKVMLSQFHTQQVSSQESLDSAVETLSSFLTNAALQAAGPGSGASGPTVPCRSVARNWKFCKRPICNKPKWFDNSCESLRRQMRITSHLLAKQPNNLYIKGKIS